MLQLLVKLNYCRELALDLLQYSPLLNSGTVQMTKFLIDLIVSVIIQDKSGWTNSHMVELY